MIMSLNSPGGSTLQCARDEICCAWHRLFIVSCKHYRVFNICGASVLRELRLEQCCGLVNECNGLLKTLVVTDRLRRSHLADCNSHS